jgi:hypothetical protein
VLEAGEFYVVSWGKRYVRMAKNFIVGAYMHQAEKFDTYEQAKAVADDWNLVLQHEKRRKARIWKIKVEEAT